MLSDLQNSFVSLARKHFTGDDSDLLIEQGLQLIRREKIYDTERSAIGINGYRARPAEQIIPEEIESQLIAILLCRGISGDNFFEATLAQKLVKELHEYLEANGEVCKAVPLPVFDWETGSVKEFYESYVEEPQPVVIRGFPSAASSSWTVDFFVEHYGDSPALLTDMETKDNYEGYIRDLSKPAPSGGDAYIHNLEDIFEKEPGLIDQLGMERLSPYLGRNYTSWANQLFLGTNSGTGTPYHCADIFNFFYQLEGRKRWYFVDPKYMFLLYPYLSEANGYQTALVDGIRTESDDINDYPLYGYCPRYVVDLEPGDLLLNPPHWYHAVGNLTKRTTAVATRWSAKTTVGNRIYRYLGLNANRTTSTWESHDERWSDVASGVARRAWIAP